MWPALERHDRSRFELFFYSLSTQSDEWTARYRALADHFEVIAELPELAAAARIAADDLDILVDLSTHTRGAKPGILALKPARVQITHVASAGVVGLSCIDFKLTDAYADIAESQAIPARDPAADAGLRLSVPAHRARKRPSVSPRGAADRSGARSFSEHSSARSSCRGAVWHCGARCSSAFPTPCWRSRRWRPRCAAFTAASWARRGIPEARVRVLPQGRDEAENLARYGVIDFVLDPMPFGGVNGTIEAIDMNVPVVTLVGRKHGERSTYSILANLGVTQTIATSRGEYVEIAQRLATDAAFKAEVKAAIRAGLQHSPLTDMAAHTRNLEQAYLQALELRYPAALAAAGNG